ncbi:hypothetical protein OC844_004467 [Tilletia horrida]|nr:hypothetical protein OC844_004467 [Tilletia horrida]
MKLAITAFILLLAAAVNAVEMQDIKARNCYDDCIKDPHNLPATCGDRCHARDPGH